jgi:hypothetical protein
LGGGGPARRKWRGESLIGKKLAGGEKGRMAEKGRTFKIKNVKSGDD